MQADALEGARCRSRLAVNVLRQAPDFEASAHRTYSCDHGASRLRSVRRPKSETHAEDADDDDADEDGVDVQELLLADDAHAEAAVRRDDLRDDDEVPGGRQVHARGIDDAGHARKGRSPSERLSRLPAPRVRETLISSVGTCQTTFAVISVLKKTVPRTTRAIFGCSPTPSQKISSSDEGGRRGIADQADRRLEEGADASEACPSPGPAAPR